MIRSVFYANDAFGDILQVNNTEETGLYMIRELMQTRASVRKFSDRQISDEDVNTILEAARHSPSGANEQPYVYGVISDRDDIGRIAEMSCGQKWINTCSRIVVLCTKIVNDDRDGRWIQRKRFPEQEKELDAIDRDIYTFLNLEEHQTKIPGTVMMLQALELGIQSTWISMFNVLEVKAFLNLPGHIVPSEMLAFGYPRDPVKCLPKKELSEIVFYGKYGM